MKNDSWRYPFKTFGDDAFDSNKDGKLTGMETVIRDAHLDNVNQNTSDSKTSITADDWDSCLTVVMKCLFVLWVIAMVAKLF